MCLKFELLGWMTQQPNLDSGLFILWAYISNHLLCTTCQFINSKGLKLVKICSLLPAQINTDSGQNGKLSCYACLYGMHAHEPKLSYRGAMPQSLTFLVVLFFFFFLLSFRDTEWCTSSQGSIPKLA